MVAAPLLFANSFLVLNAFDLSLGLTNKTISAVFQPNESCKSTIAKNQPQMKDIQSKVIGKKYKVADEKFKSVFETVSDPSQQSNSQYPTEKISNLQYKDCIKSTDKVDIAFR